MKLKTIKINLEFLGQCPSCALQDIESEMIINSDDFFECEACRIQITCFPPLAAILSWKGNGSFRSTKDKASDYYSSLLLCEASSKKGQEIYPDPNEVIEDSLDLEAYLNSVHNSYEEYLNNQFDHNAESIKQQEVHLGGIAAEEWENILELYRIVEREGVDSTAFRQLQLHLYSNRIIFAFPWIRWQEGKQLLRSGEIKFQELSLLKISMLLTTIFREDRFSDKTIEEYYKNGMLGKLFKRLEQLT